MAKGEDREIDKQKIKEAMRNHLLERRKEARTIRKIVGIIALILLLAIAGTALAGYLYVASALKPMQPDNHKQENIEVPIGSSATSIGNLLQKKGIIKNGTVFKYYVKFNNISGFQAGNYQLTPSMSLEEITKTLQTGKLVREAMFKITVPEGLQLDEIAAIISKQTGHKKSDIMDRLDNKDFIKQQIEKYPNLLDPSILENADIKHPLEGYLFPATYPIYEEKPTVDSVIDTMIKQTSQVVTKYSAQLAEKDMDIHELLTMASLIEKEATAEVDRKMISSVFYNRMETDMPLQTDPTVLYALGKHKERTTYKDLEVDSPYNTYQHKGLPPGPIAAAGESSIEAALEPEESDYLYFLAEYGTGKVHFSKTLEEHNVLKEKYITNKRE